MRIKMNSSYRQQSTERRPSLDKQNSTGLRIKNVDILFENNRTNFDMGETVHGKLRIKFQGLLTLAEIQIGLVCISKMQTSDDEYESKKLLEEYFRLPNAVVNQTLLTGTHEIPFRFPLPGDREVPPSFDGRYGCINYFVECLVPDDEHQHRTGVEVKLERPVRTNLLLSVSGSSEKDLGIFCIGSGNVTMEASIPRKGHLAGETIEVKTVIKNTTSLKVKPRAVLYQTQIFMSGVRHRTLEAGLGETINGPEIDPCEFAENILEIVIPPRAPLTMKSSMVTVKYFVHVTLDIPHNIDIHINLPIVITNKRALREAKLAPVEGSTKNFNIIEHTIKEKEKALKEKQSKRLGSASSSRKNSACSNSVDVEDI